MNKCISIILFSIIILSCSETDNDEIYIKTFNKTLGVGNTKNLDRIVIKGESLMMKAYNVGSIDSAYVMYLKQISKQNILFDINLDLHEIKSFIKLFDEDNLKKQCFKYDMLRKQEVFGIDRQGDFLKTFKLLSEQDTIASAYVDINTMAGSPDYSLVAESILEQYNLNNYLIKRIIIVDFLYRTLEFIHYNKGFDLEKANVLDVNGNGRRKVYDRDGNVKQYLYFENNQLIKRVRLDSL